MIPKLSWQTVTVQQFLDIQKLTTDTTLDDMGKVERAICVLYDKSQKQVDEMQIVEFTRLCKQVNFVFNSKIPIKKVNRIRVSGRNYRIQYNPSKLKHRQYVELMTFGHKPEENMHLIMASVVNRITWYGRALKNKAEEHEQIASDMLQAKVVDVYSAQVFFCKLYVNLIKNMRGYLVDQMTMNSKMTKEKANELVTASMNAMAGFIPLNNSANFTEKQLTAYTKKMSQKHSTT